MKKFIIITCVLLILLACVQAATIKVAWDAPPAGHGWQKVRIYEKTGTTYAMVAEVPATEVQATIAGVVPGVHRYVARSFDGTWESVDSNEVATPSAPNPPTTLRITLPVIP